MMKFQVYLSGEKNKYSFAKYSLIILWNIIIIILYMLKLIFALFATVQSKATKIVAVGDSITEG